MSALTSGNLVLKRGVDEPSIKGHGPSAITISNTIHALFDPVTPQQALAGSTDYRIIGVQNTHAFLPIIGLKVYLSPNASSLGGVLFEFGSGITSSYGSTWDSIPDEITAPSGITFYPAGNTPATGVAVGDVPASNYFRQLWIKRIVLPNTQPLAADSVTMIFSNRVS